MIATLRETRLLVGMLALLSLIGYALRSNITVAQELMAPDLGLSMGDMGLITGLGFQLAYALFQVPAGVLGDRFGARPILGISMIGMGVASLASGLAGSVGNALFLLFTARSLLGMAQSATYPVGALAIRQRVPAEYQTTASAIFISTSLLGSALVPLTLAPLMAAAGWRTVFLVSGLVGLLGAACWFAFAPPIPRPAAVTTLGTQMRRALALFRNRDIVLLSLAYLFHSAVFFVFIFWFFRYLIDARGMSLLASGFWGSLPLLTAFVLAPIGGMFTDRLGRRLSPALARRNVAVGCLVAAALLVLLGANLSNPFLAIAALSLSVASINAAEGPFWVTITSLGGSTPGAAAGVLNLMGNLGGVVSIWAVPHMREALGWTALLAVWAGVAIVAAALWLLVRVDRPEPA
ncbi:MAG: MFS transporter [Gemmatimonadales bacterium]